MTGSTSDQQATWFTAHSGLALFCAGVLMVFTAVVIPEQPAAIATVLILIGAAVMLIGGLLPRLAGTIKITPGSVEIALAERLEATRLEAMRRDPEHVDEAISRAFERLRAEVLGPAAHDGSPAPSPEAPDMFEPPDVASEPRAAEQPRSRLVAKLVAAAVVAAGALVAVQAFLVVESAPPPVTPIPPVPVPEAGFSQYAWWWFLILAGAVAVVLGGILITLRRRRADDVGPVFGRGILSEPPSEFARKVVDAVVVDAERVRERPPR